MKVHLLTLLLAIPASSAFSRTVHILPLGDSITQGGITHREEYTYRWPLFQMLVDEGVDFNFIGSLNTGVQSRAKWPEAHNGRAFDPDHEGIYGIKTAAALERLPAAGKEWEAAPDIALIHLGTNDQGARDLTAAIVNPLREIILLLREQNPGIVVLLGHLNFNDGIPKTQIRPLVNELAAEMNTEESPVITVNHFEDWQENPNHPETDTFDWAHPNPQGQRKMAVKWFEAMRPYLSDSD